MNKRKLDNWADTFYSFTEGLPSPQLFRRWAGIALVAATLQRRTWVHPNVLMGKLYPNLFTIFVAPPGVGKTILTSVMFNLWSRLNQEGHDAKFHLASSSLSYASFADELDEATINIIRMGEVPPLIKFNSLTICSNELGVLLPEYDPTFMNRLTDAYDCRIYTERKRGKDLRITIENPQLNFVAATTPGFITETMPPAAWEQGFLSRTFLIYSGEQVKRNLFNSLSMDASVQLDLVHDLRRIFELYGEYQWTAEAEAAMTAWNAAGGPPIPEHPRLMHYNTRRVAHVLKLCQVAAASTSDDLLITVQHFNQAMDWLLELELYLPDIFKATSAGGSSRAIDDVWHWAALTYVKENKPIPEHRLVQYLQARVAIHEVLRIIEVMERGQILIPELGTEGKVYRPRPRKDLN